jgi:uncharacterized membrane-anchored protein
MRRVSRISVVFGLLMLVLATGQAQAQDREHELFEKLHQRTGEISLGDGVATLKVGPNFTYLDANDAEIFLTQIWDNERGSGSKSLGALLPHDVDLLGDASWAVIIDYDEDGYVSDADAKTIDYDELLSQMQADTAEASKEREKEGGATVALVGWAKRPYYDAATHKLYWAKRLRFGDSDEEILNYDIRALGRHGTLTLQVVASIGDLPMIEGRLSEILDMVSFNPGQTYAEFDSRTDKTAEYTIAGLIAGGILAKVGFFKALWIGILALKKLIIIGAVALFGGLSAFVKRLLGRNRQPSG